MLKWFGDNEMIANPRKFKYMLVGKSKPLKIEILGFQLESAKSVNLLGITFDHNSTLIRIYQMFARWLVQKLKAYIELEMPWIKNKQNYCITLLSCHSLITVL